MNNRFTLSCIAAAFALTGCAKNSTDKPVADFSNGDTVVIVTHVPFSSSDGTPLFVTVDGNDAGELDTGKSVALHVPAGKHQIGGYARSLIGHVTIPAVQITTKTDRTKHVEYTVTNSKPLFKEGKDELKPQPTPAVTTTTPVTTTPAAAATTTTPVTTTPAVAATTTTPAAAATTTTPATTTPEAAATDTTTHSE